jgi:2-C-methyl-D-erythritol 4-phosphate cytidylyltransferase
MYFAAMQQYAIIVAGGKGSRMENDLPKQFLPLGNKPLMYYCIASFIATFSDIQIVIVSHKDYLQSVEKVLSLIESKHKMQVVVGGDSRYASVQNGLHCIPQNIEAIVYVHDAARPFINSVFLKQLQNDCLLNGNAVPAISIHESVRKIEGNSSAPIDREQLKVIQTPQVFKNSVLQKSFLQAEQALFTDEASVCEMHGEKIFLSDGLIQNIKITTPAQLKLAEWMIHDWKI